LAFLAFDKKSDWIVRPGVIEQIGLQNIEDRISALQAKAARTFTSAARRRSRDAAIPSAQAHVLFPLPRHRVKYDD